jgi:hypothetical protein
MYFYSVKAMSLMRMNFLISLILKVRYNFSTKWNSFVACEEISLRKQTDTFFFLIIINIFFAHKSLFPLWPSKLNENKCNKVQESWNFDIKNKCTHSNLPILNFLFSFLNRFPWRWEQNVSSIEIDLFLLRDPSLRVIEINWFRKVHTWELFLLMCPKYKFCLST